jgi:hypothetical protein
MQHGKKDVSKANLRSVTQIRKAIREPIRIAGNAANSQGICDDVDHKGQRCSIWSSDSVAFRQSSGATEETGGPVLGAWIAAIAPNGHAIELCSAAPL